MKTKQSEHQMRTIEARIKEEQELRLTAFYADKVKKAQAKLWEVEELAAIKRMDAARMKAAMGGTYWE